MKKKILLTIGLVLCMLMTACSKGSAAQKDVPLNDILTAVKDAYGEDYLPSMPLDAASLEQLFGLTEDMYVEALGEMPMMSTHVDTFVAVHAKEGQADAVEAALKDYQDYQINEAMNYPMNMGKVNGSEVYRNGDYVFFIMLGAIQDDAEDENAAKEFAKEQNQIAIKAIEDKLK